MNWQKILRSFFNFCTRYRHSACLLMRSVRWMLCTVYSWCICHYGPQVMKFEPIPVIRPSRSLRSKRFQSSNCAKVRVGAKKKVEGWGGGDKRKRLPANPTILENAPWYFTVRFICKLTARQNRSITNRLPLDYQICKIALFSNRTCSRRLQKLSKRVYDERRLKLWAISAEFVVFFIVWHYPVWNLVRNTSLRRLYVLQSGCSSVCVEMFSTEDTCR